MSAFDYAYRSLATTGQKVSKRPRLVIPVILGTIALLGALQLVFYHTGQPNVAWGHPKAVNTEHGLASLENLHDIPPTRNLHMTEEQCGIAFPELYKEADRAQAYFSTKGGISKQDVDAAEEEGNARVVILNNTVSRPVLRVSVDASHCQFVRQLFVKAFRGGYNSRTNAAVATVYRTLITSVEPLPDVE